MEISHCADRAVDFHTAWSDASNAASFMWTRRGETLCELLKLIATFVWLIILISWVCLTRFVAQGSGLRSPHYYFRHKIEHCEYFIPLLLFLQKFLKSNKRTSHLKALIPVIYIHFQLFWWRLYNVCSSRSSESCHYCSFSPQISNIFYSQMPGSFYNLIR